MDAGVGAEPNRNVIVDQVIDTVLILAATGFGKSFQHPCFHVDPVLFLGEAHRRQIVAPLIPFHSIVKGQF